MWAQPPGGLTPSQERDRKVRRIQAAALALVVMCSMLVTARSALFRSAPVSQEDAVSAYRRTASRPSHRVDRPLKERARTRVTEAEAGRSPVASGRSPQAATSARTAPAHRVVSANAGGS